MIVRRKEVVKYSVKRIRAYGMYFWYVKDIVKHSFLWKSGGWFNFVVYSSLPKDNRKYTKSGILYRVPGYFSSKKEALKTLHGK